MTLYFLPCGKTTPKPPLLLVINLSSLSQLIQANFGFYFDCFFSQIFFYQLFWAKWFFKASTPFQLGFECKTTLLASPLNPQPRTILIHSSPFQIFQISLPASLDQICQIW